MEKLSLEQFFDKICDLLKHCYLGLAVALNQGQDGLMQYWKSFCAKALSLVPPGMYGTELQNEMCAKNRQISAVFALIRGEGDNTEVLMRLRKSTEPYGGLYCLEANVCFVWETCEMLIERMLKKLGVVATSVVHLSEADFSIKEERGCHWLHCVYAVQVDGEPQLQDGDGRMWVKVNNLPSNVVEHHMVALWTGLWYRKNTMLYNASIKRTRQALHLPV